MSATAAENRSSRKTTAKSSWLKSGLHTITLHSGAVVKIRYPNLALMIRLGLVPTQLRTVAMKVAKGEINMVGGGIGEDMPDDKSDEAFEELGKLVELLDMLVMQMVAEPELTQEDVDQMPAEDRDMLLAIANRERDVDAVGRRLGVEPLDRWDTFRHFHKCAEDCPSCKKVREHFSSIDLGSL
jgi:hypothetical protein